MFDLDRQYNDVDFFIWLRRPQFFISNRSTLHTGRLVTALVKEFLEYFNLEFTLAVLDPEAGCVSTCIAQMHKLLFLWFLQLRVHVMINDVHPNQSTFIWHVEKGETIKFQITGSALKWIEIWLIDQSINSSDAKFSWVWFLNLLCKQSIGCLSYSFGWRSKKHWLLSDYGCQYSL